MDKTQIQTYYVIVIDPDENPPRAFAVRGVSDQELTALSDCDYTIVDPLLNQIYVFGSWEPISIGTIHQDGGIVQVR